MEIADALQGKARLMPSKQCTALYSAQIQIASDAVQEGHSEEEGEDSWARYLPDPQPYTLQVPAQCLGTSRKVYVIVHPLTHLP